ncbi:MAG: polysaccharide deacetylase family protein [Gimesia sp.]
MKPIISLLLFFTLASSFTFAAETSETKPSVPAKKVMQIQSGVVFTFDDRFIDQWVKQIPLFKRYDAKVTFFVDHFHTLKPTKIEGLRKLKAAGHTIGCHGAKHRKAVDYVKKMGMENYLKAEIYPAVKLMSDAGLKPTAFAYPSSSRNAEIDQALLKTFRHLRGGTGMSPNQRMRDLKTIFVSVDEISKTGCLIGTGIDYTGTEKRPDYLVQIKDAMDHAKKRGEIVIFYAHNISDNGPGHHLPPKALEEILAHARHIGLPTLTYDDLP